MSSKAGTLRGACRAISLGPPSSVLDEITARRMQDVGYVELPFKQYFHYPDTHTGTSRFSVSTQSLDRIWMGYRNGAAYATQGGLVRVAGCKESGAFTSTASIANTTAAGAVTQDVGKP